MALYDCSDQRHSVDRQFPPSTHQYPADLLDSDAHRPATDGHNPCRGLIPDFARHEPASAPPMTAVAE